ncbi:MAG: FadR/GntR family transcriptional regulator [Parvibaculaceae bacterium]
MSAKNIRKADLYEIGDRNAGERPSRLYERVAKTLIGWVLDGTYSPGQALPNDYELCDRLDVSRTVIREAIQALALRGVLEVQHGAGTYFKPRENWDLLDALILEVMEETGAIAAVVCDILDVRRAMEAEAVALASMRATHEDIAGLQDLLQRMEKPAIEDDEYLDLDVAFHSAIVFASRNLIARHFIRQISGLVRLMMAAHNTQRKAVIAQSRLVSNAGHRTILRAIEERNPERARAAMLVHVQTLERAAAEIVRTKGLKGAV